MNGNWVRNKRKGNRKSLFTTPQKIRPLKVGPIYFLPPFIKYFREWAPTWNIYIPPLFRFSTLPHYYDVFWEEKTLPKTRPSKFVSYTFPRYVCCSPAASNLEETAAALKLASRAAKVVRSGCPHLFSEDMSCWDLNFPLCFHVIGEKKSGFIYPKKVGYLYIPNN